MKGDLYGLWTHTGNVLVQLAIAASDSQIGVWKSFCDDHCLENVGTWGTQEPKSTFRPQDLDKSLGYVYVRSTPDDGSLVVYSIPSISTTSSPQATDLTVLKTASPYRAALVDDKRTEKLLESGLRSQKKICPSSLTGHWSEQKVHFDFLQDLRRHFSDQRMEVKQFQQPGSDYIAFQIKCREQTFAFGFPPDFDRNRQVQVYCGNSAPDNICLPEKSTEAVAALLACVSQHRNSDAAGEEMPTAGKEASKTDDKASTKKDRKGQAGKKGTVYSSNKKSDWLVMVYI